MTTCGTPHYWAPEIFEGQPQGTPVDLWSLGTLVYEIVVGHAPFWGSMEELRAKVLAVDIRYPPGLLSNEAINLFYCLMQYEPRNRVATTRLLAEHPWVRGAVLALASDGIAPPGTILTVSSDDVGKPGTLVSPSSTTRAESGISVPVATVTATDDSEGGSMMPALGTSSSISAQESAVAAAMAAAAATAAAKSAVNAERWSGPLASPVWSTGPSNSTSGPKALSAVVVPRGVQADAVVAPAVRPAHNGRGNAVALSAALTSSPQQQPPLAVVATADSHTANATGYGVPGEQAVTKPGAIDWQTPEKASPSRSPLDSAAEADNWR
jgi:serine/threonine protein kinase